MKTRLLKTALCASTLFVAALVATPVHADDELVTLSSPGDVTLTEGDSATLVFTLSNNSPFSIVLGSFGLTTPITGDESDAINSSSFDTQLTTCGTALGPTSSCNLVLDIGTPSGAGETDGDFGVQIGAASQVYDIATIGVGYVAFAPPFTITVNDVTTPEPSSLLLLGSGLLGMLGFGRKRLI